MPLIVPLSQTQRLGGDGVLLTATIWAVILFACSSGSSRGSAPEPLKLMLAPPRVEKLLARRTFQDGGQVYIQLAYDNGDFFFKKSNTRRALSERTLGKGDCVVGRVGTSVWVSAEALGNDLWVATGALAPSTNMAVLQHEANTRTLADFESRLGRSLLSFGIELPFDAVIVSTNGTFMFTNQGGVVAGSISLLQANARNRIPFEAEWEERRPTGEARMRVHCRGELAADTMLPSWFDMVELDKAGRKQPLAAAEVLEAKLASRPLAKEKFAVEANVIGGYRALVTREDDRLRAKTVDEALGTRKVYVAGRMLPPRLIRGVILGFMVVASVAFAAALFVRSKARHQQ